MAREPGITAETLDVARLRAAYEQVRAELLAERTENGHWIGELATSALSTATAVSALSLVRKHRHREGKAPVCVATSDQLDSLIQRGIEYLVAHQNSDGGWGDTDKSYSNIATTMLSVAALHLAVENVAEQHAEILRRADSYIDSKGRLDGLRKRYGKDKTFAVPILTNCALAGLVDWRDVSSLPFELAALPQRFYRFVRLPVVSYAIPALVAIGQAKFFHQPPWNPLLRGLRAAAVGPSLRVLKKIQPASGGYLEAVPLTSFVVMSLAATGRADHAVTQDGVRFLIDSVRPDGSWPIDTNLATWNTTLSLVGLSACEKDVAAVATSPSAHREAGLLDWLLSCQNKSPHPFTGAEPGGWGWSDLSGAVPDADDTPGALLALRAWHDSPSCSAADRQRIRSAASDGIRWLLNLQNRDGGWPTFCRGWGTLPFDRSGADLTAHVLRALVAWNETGGIRTDASFAKQSHLNTHGSAETSPSRLETPAAQRAWAFLARQQRPDGSWVPLWFGNQDHPDEENPVYGTAKVLMAYRDAGLIADKPAQRGLAWLVENQNNDGSWGTAINFRRIQPETNRGHSNSGETANGADRRDSSRSVEETALAVEALFADLSNTTYCRAAMTGLDWLLRSVETKTHLACSPIGFYFAKLWYYEKLYPLTFTVSTLGHALRLTMNN